MFDCPHSVRARRLAPEKTQLKSIRGGQGVWRRDYTLRLPVGPGAADFMAEAIGAKLRRVPTMVLTLVIVARDGIVLPTRARKTFRGIGGSIGRLTGNDLMLDDPHVSRRHAEIRCTDGRFYLVDLSVNGVFVGSPQNRLVRDEPYEIKADDVILIGPYEIRASIAGEPPEEPSGPLTIAQPFGSADATALPWSDFGSVPPQPPALGADPSPRAESGTPIPDRTKSDTPRGGDADDQ